MDLSYVISNGVIWDEVWDSTYVVSQLGQLRLDLGGEDVWVSALIHHRNICFEIRHQTKWRLQEICHPLC